MSHSLYENYNINTSLELISPDICIRDFFIYLKQCAGFLVIIDIKYSVFSNKARMKIRYATLFDVIFDVIYSNTLIN